MKVNDLIRELPKLSQQELAVVRAAVDHLLDGSSNTEDPTRSLYDVVSGAIGRGHLSFQEFHKMAIYKVWRRDAPAVVCFIDKTFPQSHKVTKTAIMSFLVRALIDDMKMLKIPITIGTVTRQIDQLPQVLDRCFPGYVESNMTHVIVRAMERK